MCPRVCAVGFSNVHIFILPLVLNTRKKLISMIVYMDDELQFSKDELNHKKLINLIRRYSFVFEKGNMNDLCNWFVFFHDYSVPLLRSTETIFEKKLREEDNPIFVGKLSYL